MTLEIPTSNSVVIIFWKLSSMFCICPEQAICTMTIPVVQIVKAQTTSERQANQCLNLTANGWVNVIALRSCKCRLDFQHPTETDLIHHVIVRRSLYTTLQMERKEGTGGSRDLWQASQGKCKRAAVAAPRNKRWQGKSSQAGSCKGPATSISIVI
jgi:hypothetical protein